MNERILASQQRNHPINPKVISRGFLVFSTLTALAEGAQQVIILWTAFQIGGSGLLVGWVVFAGYAPAAVVGLAVRQHADRGDARVLASWTNYFLAAGSLILGLQQFFAGHALLSIVVILASQILLGLVKLANKAVISRLLRGCLPKAAAKRTLQLSSSSNLAGQVVGAGAAGLLLNYGLGPVGLLTCGVLYATSAVVLGNAVRNVPVELTAAQSAVAQSAVKETKAKVRISPALASVLIFSIPSSGALQAVTTLLPPLSEATAPGAPGYYAIVNVITMAGGFGAGILLSTKIGNQKVILRWALPATAVVLALLNATRNEVAVAALTGLLTLIITMHVIVMQVLTNQTPAPDQVGSFAITRNVVASLAKAIFALAAGVISAVAGLDAAVWAVAVTCVVFALIWQRRESSREGGALGGYLG